MKFKSVVSLMLVMSSSQLAVQPAYAFASSTPTSVSIQTPKAMPSYFYISQHQLTGMIVKSILSEHTDLHIRGLKVHSRQFDEGSPCDHIFFTFRSDNKLFIGLGELSESRNQNGKLFTRTLIHEIDLSKPFDMQYAFSPCFPSIAGKVNGPSIQLVDIIEGNGRMTRIFVRDGYFFKVLDHGIDICAMQRVRFEGLSVKNRLVFVMHGADLYPDHRGQNCPPSPLL